jgi:polyisoprenoid-binding protein YceI
MPTAARTALVSLLALAITVSAGPGEAASFTVDVSSSSLVVQLFRDGVAARLAHDHVVQARAFTGTMVYDPRNPDASSIQVTVEVGSLQADDPATRRKFGLSGEISESDRADIDKAMRSDGQLAAARFPSLSFKSSAIARQSDGRFLVTGRLTIRGVTNEVKFPAEIALDGDLRGRAKLTFKQSSFGYQPYSAALGAIKNKDEVTLHVDLTAKAP